MGKQRVVAVNIGSANIIAVQGVVTDGHNGLKTAVVERIATIPTPLASVRANGIHMPDIVAQTLREMWRQEGFQTKDVIAGVNSRRLRSGARWIPNFPPDQLAALLPSLTAKYKVLPDYHEGIDDSLSHYALRSRDIADGNGTMVKQLLLAVISVPKNDAQMVANVIEDAGLELVGMDLVGLAALRGTMLPRREDQRVVDMIVEIGHGLVTMVLHNNGSIRAVTTTGGMGGQSVNDSIADALRKGSLASDLDPDTIKRSLATLSKRDDIDDTLEKVMKSAKTAAASQMNVLSQHLLRFVDEYLKAANDADETSKQNGLPRNEGGEERGLASISLCGGGSGLHGLAARLALPIDKEGFGVQVDPVAISKSFVLDNGNPVPALYGGVNVVSTVGLLTAERISETS